MIVSREKQSHGLVVANLGHGDPNRDKGSHWTRGHRDARPTTVAGLDRDAASIRESPGARRAPAATGAGPIESRQLPCRPRGPGTRRFLAKMRAANRKRVLGDSHGPLPIRSGASIWSCYLGGF